jgi:hypothetical protein
MKTTLKQLVDNGLLKYANRIIDNDDECYAWRLERDWDGFDVPDEGIEYLILSVSYNDDDFTRYRLDSEVEFDGTDIIIVENFSKTNHRLGIQKFVDIDPKNFINKQ